MRNFFKEHWKYFKEEGTKCVDDLKSIKTFYKQVPNLLTIFRLISTVPINICFFTGNVAASLIICGIAAITDLFDGKFARKYNCSSEFGAELDAICDKLFILLMAIPIVIQNPFMLLNMALEVGIIGTNLKAKKDGKEVKSTMIGKVKTWFLSATVIMGYFLPLLKINPNLLTSLLITIPTAALQTATLTKYIQINNEPIKEKKESDDNKTTISVDEIKESKEKHFSNNLVKPATLEELKILREELLMEAYEKGFQKTKTDLK